MTAAAGAARVWVRDLRSEEYAAEARRQSQVVARGKGEVEAMALVDAISADHSDEA